MVHKPPLVGDGGGVVSDSGRGIFADTSGGSSGSGGGPQYVTKDLLDAKIETVAAQNQTAYTELKSEVAAIKPGATPWQIVMILAGFIVGTTGLISGIFAIVSWLGDGRSDRGLEAQVTTQETLDRLDKLDIKIEEIHETIQLQPEQSNPNTAVDE